MVVTFIGLGSMGLPMATNIIKAGFSLQAYNRSLPKAKPLEQLGAKLFETAGAAANESDIVVTMLSDDAAVEEISAKLIGSMKRGSVHVSMSTIGPATASSLSERFSANGLHYLSAPVMGRPPAAAAKLLYILTSGNESAKEKAQPVLDAMGQRIFDYGADPAAANTVKLMMNYMIFVITEMLSEVMLMAEKSGIDKQLLLDTMLSTIFGAPVIKTYGGLVAQEQDQPNGFKTSLASKDLRLAQEAAAKYHTSLPLGDTIQKHFKEIIAAQGGNNDVSLLITHLRSLIAS
ncbi:MAG: NAD(P)-dependent oxidoreductase [Chitinophagaceae bacterium]|nr:MAG: NAD(P)-dependent oxidoreductase [Chitinophagaceae bacterium]